MLASLAQLYTSGARVDWAGFDRGYPRRKLALPTYPFQRRRYWIETSQPSPRADVSLTATKPARSAGDISKWFYQIEWKRRAVAEIAKDATAPSSGHWIVFSEAGEFADNFSGELARRGIAPTIVTPGAKFEKVTDARKGNALKAALLAALNAVDQEEPRRANLIASRKLYLAGWYGTLAILVFTHLFVVRNAMGLPTAHPLAIVMVTALFLIAMYMGQVRETLDDKTSHKLVEQLLHIPSQLEELLRRDAIYEDLSKALFRSSDFLYLGRGVHFPIALEGALKLKEISYIHAEGYPAGEMKHGPNALIDGNLPTVVLATQDPHDELSHILYEKTLSNIQEVKAREGIVVAVTCEGDEQVKKVADYVIPIGNTHDLLLPILEVVPLQLLAYHIAVRRGCDVDQPRNLAKSVTVE